MKSGHINKAFMEESHIRIFIKWWLAFLVLLLPFQSKIRGFIRPFSADLSVFIEYLDELTIVILLPLALFKIFMNKEYPIRLYGALLFPLVFLFVLGFVSGLLNGNAINVTALGTFAYVKGFLVIFIFAAFFQNYNEVRHFFNILIRLAIILLVIAFFQEVWALKSRYILGNENYLISKWRLGIYRPASLLPSPNLFGLYILLIFTLYISLTKKINYIIFIGFILGIIICVSKIVYIGLIFLCIAQIYRRKKPFIYVLVLTLVLLVTMVFFKNYDFNKRMSLVPQITEGVSTYIEYRKYTRQIAISIWKDHMFFGAGPGMYGGEVSLKYKSGIYNEYSYSEDIKWYLQGSGNINQFWFQLLAEMGIIGVIAFGLFFINFIVVLLILRIWASSYNIGNLFVGLLIITLTLIIFTTYTGLNNTSLMLTFSAIVGMAIGSEKEKYG